MGVDAVYTSVIHDELGRRLLSHFRNTGDVVGAVAHERFDINKCLRRYTVFFEDILRVIVFCQSLSLFGLGDPDADVIRRALKKVPVARHKCNLHAFFLTAPCKRAQDIIRLQARLFPYLYAHGLKDLLDQRDLFPQFGRHRLARPLVLLVDLMAESWRVDIKRHSEIVCLLLVEYLEQYIQKPEYRACMNPGRVREVRHSVKRPVQNTVPVHEHKLLFTHSSLILSKYRSQRDLSRTLLIKHDDHEHDHKGGNCQDLSSYGCLLDPVAVSEPLSLQFHPFCQVLVHIKSGACLQALKSFVDQILDPKLIFAVFALIYVLQKL